MLKTIKLRQFFFHLPISKLKKISDRQDVESAEDSKVCNPGQDICYGTLTISNVNVTLEGLKKVIDLLEIKVEKGCGKSSDYTNNTESKAFGTYNQNRKCWTTKLHEESYPLSDKG